MPLQVIGAGFGRTGTMSLRDALNTLGFGPCYHMSEVIRNPHYARYWAELSRGGKVDWEEVFAGYRSTVDWPACSYWKELAERWPEAKVILTVRDPEQWYRSTQNTIFSDEHLARFEGPDADPDFRAMVDKLYYQTFDHRGDDKDHAIAVYNAHNEDVKRSLPPERLLVLDPAQGWEPLCDFLGVAVPEAQFPCINTTRDWKERPRPTNNNP